VFSSIECPSSWAFGDHSCPAVFSCSPRKGGNSDDATDFFCTGILQAGGRFRRYNLRDFIVRPCVGCLRCAHDPGGECPFASLDQSGELFQALLCAPLIFIAAPIYFYHLPAQFKAWIDRSQSFYTRREKGDPALIELRPRPAIISLAAGRPTGEKLFDGALLTLKYFLVTFNVHIQKRLVFRGMDSIGDLNANSPARDTLIAAGRQAWTSLSC
jgi:hypothetical protein